VVPYCRCIYTTGISAAFKFKLRTSVKAVSGKFPVYKIAAVIYWYTGEEFKCRINKIKIRKDILKLKNGLDKR
jgi:hypothetical protein